MTFSVQCAMYKNIILTINTRLRTRTTTLNFQTKYRSQARAPELYSANYKGLSAHHADFHVLLSFLCSTYWVQKDIKWSPYLISTKRHLTLSCNYSSIDDLDSRNSIVWWLLLSIFLVFGELLHTSHNKGKRWHFESYFPQHLGFLSKLVFKNAAIGDIEADCMKWDFYSWKHVRKARAKRWQHIEQR